MDIRQTPVPSEALYSEKDDFGEQDVIAVSGTGSNQTFHDNFEI